MCKDHETLFYVSPNQNLLKFRRHSSRQPCSSSYILQANADSGIQSAHTHLEHRRIGKRRRWIVSGDSKIRVLGNILARVHDGRERRAIGQWRKDVICQLYSFSTRQCLAEKGCNLQTIFFRLDSASSIAQMSALFCAITPTKIRRSGKPMIMKN